MKVITKYTAIQLGTETVKDEVLLKLSYGMITGPYYSTKHPTEEFDTYEQAVEYAYENSKYGRWLILPVVEFDNY